jgi:putative DNA primase/helicase
MTEKWVEDVFASFNDEPPKKESHGATLNGKANGRGNNTALISRKAANIRPEKVDWLWVGRIARGKHTCIAGEPGTGKSQLSIIVTAVMTTSGEWPCGEGWAPLGTVIILSAEDGAADTIVPRLMAAGADRDRVHIVSAVRNHNGKGQRTFNLQTDIELLERKISEIGDVALVIVDPVSSYLGKTDSHKNSEVRGVLEPLSDMAERTRVAVLTVTHFNKTGVNGTTKALHRFIGSIAFTGAPRTAFAVIEDPEDANHRLFLHAKNNLAAPPQGLGFRLEQTIVADEILGSRVIWDSEPVTITANQALAAEAAGPDQRTAKAEAMEFLTEALAGGPTPAAEIMKMAREHGLTSKAVRSAREALHVKVQRDGFGPGSKSLWSCAKNDGVADPYMPNSPIDAQQSNWASMGSEGIYGEQAPHEQCIIDEPPGDDLSIPEFLRR